MEIAERKIDDQAFCWRDTSANCLCSFRFTKRTRCQLILALGARSLNSLRQRGYFSLFFQIVINNSVFSLRRLMIEKTFCECHQVLFRVFSFVWVQLLIAELGWKNRFSFIYWVKTRLETLKILVRNLFEMQRLKM